MFVYRPSDVKAVAPKSTNGHLRDIDTLRGVAALVVVMLHTRDITWVGLHQVYAENGLRLSAAAFQYAVFPLSFGAIGVPVFFVLSGYCIHRYQAMAAASGRGQAFSALTFLLRRFLRIYPVLLGALIVTWGADSLSALVDPPSVKLGDLGVKSFLINLGSLQGLIGPTYGSNDALWTLSIEVQFYLVYPLLVALMRRAGLSATLVIVAALNLASYWVFERRGLTLFLSYYLAWYFGVLIAEGEAQQRLRLVMGSPRRVGLAKAAALALAVAGCGVFFASKYLAFNLWSVAFAIFFAQRIVVGSAFTGALAKGLAKVGEFSYSLYIVHLPIVVLLFSYGYRSAQQASLGPGVAIVVSAVVAAYLFSWAFERPALALSRRVRERSAQGAAAGSNTSTSLSTSTLG